MKQKYDNDYTWLLQHTRKHMGMDESLAEKAIAQDRHKDDGDDHDRDGIKVDSDVIVSEYRLLYLRYKE